MRAPAAREEMLLFICRLITNFLPLFLMRKEAISRLFAWKSVERNNDPVWRVLLPEQLYIHILFRRVRNCGKRLLPSSWQSVRSSVCPHGVTQFPLDVFSWNFTFKDFWKSSDKIKMSLKYYKTKGYFTLTHIYTYVSMMLHSS